MSQSKKTDYIILAVLGAFAAVVVTLLVATGQVQDRDQERRVVRTTHGTDRGGLMALYLLLGRMGTDVHRWEQPFEEGQMQALHVLMVMDARVPVRAQEREELSRWVRAGGVLVCTSEVCEQVEGFSDLRATESPLAPAGPEASRRGAPRRGAPLPLARDVESPSFATEAVLETRRDLPAAGKVGEASPLLVDSAGTRIASQPLGRGTVIVLADGGFLDNGHLAQGDNAVLAVNLVAYAVSIAGGGRVAFDEYHLGFGDAEGGMGLLAGLLFTSPPGWAVLVITACGGMFLFMKGRRFGPRRQDPPARRRSKLDYARSVGATWRAAGANGLVFWLLYQRFRRRCAAAGGVSPSASCEQLASAVPLDNPAQRDKLLEFLVAGDHAEIDDPMPKGLLATWARFMSHLERKFTDGHSTGR